jgi:hypothetical protein
MYTQIMTLWIKHKFEEVDVDGGKCNIIKYNINAI